MIKQKILSWKAIGVLTLSFISFILTGAIVRAFFLAIILNFSQYLSASTLNTLLACENPTRWIMYVVFGAVFSYTLVTHMRVNAKGLRKPLLVALSLILCGFMLSSVFYAPLVRSETVAASGYFLSQPLPIADWYIGALSDGSFFAINGSSWNTMTATEPWQNPAPWVAYASNTTAIESAALASITYGEVYLKEVPFSLTLMSSIPANVEVVDNVNGQVTDFVNPASSYGQPYTISVGQGVTAGYYVATDGCPSGGRICWVSTDAGIVINDAANVMIEGGTISLTNGTFAIRTPIVLPYKGIQLIGVGASWIDNGIYGYYGSCIMAYSNMEYMLTLNGQFNLVSNIYIDCNGQHSTEIYSTGDDQTIEYCMMTRAGYSSANYGVAIKGTAFNLRIENDWIESNWNGGIWIYGQPNDPSDDGCYVWITNCVFFNNRAFDICLNNTASDVWIEDNRFIGTPQSIIFQNCNDVLSTNYFEASSVHPMTAAYQFIGTNANIQISNDIFNGTGQASYYIETMSGSVNNNCSVTGGCISGLTSTPFYFLGGSISYPCNQTLQSQFGLGNGNQQGVADRIWLVPIFVPCAGEITSINFNLNTGSAGTSIGVGVYADNGMTPVGGSLLYSTTASADSAIAVSVAPNLFINGKSWVWVGLQTYDTTVKFDTGMYATLFYNGSSTPNMDGCYFTNTGSFTFPSTCPSVSVGASSEPRPAITLTFVPDP
jgi:hypothetical protein